MPIEQFLYSFPDAKKSEGLKDSDGKEIIVYRLARPDEDTREIYFLRDDELLGASIIFGAKRTFDSVLADAKKMDGEPTDRGNIFGVTFVYWERGNWRLDLTNS